MQRISLILCVFLLYITPLLTKAAPVDSQMMLTPGQNIYINQCLDLIKTIATDAKQFNANNPPPAWASLAWLQNKLGGSQHSTIQISLYQWKDYTIWYSELGTVVTFGDFPNNTTRTNPNINPTLAEAIQVLGKPESEESETLIKHVWRCNSDKDAAHYNDAIVALTDQQGNLLHVQANDKVTINQIQLSATPLQAKYNDLAKKNIEEQHQKAIAELIKHHNARFSTTFTTLDDLSNGIIQHYQDFYAKLRDCTAGTYQFFTLYNTKTSMPAIVDNTSVVSGKDGAGLCMVKTTLKLPAEKPQNQGTIIFTCKYQASSLSAFTDAEATTDAIVTDSAAATSSKTNERNWRECAVETHYPDHTAFEEF